MHRARTVRILLRVVLLLVCTSALVGVATQAGCSPYFVLDTQMAWQSAMGIEIKGVTPMEWDDYMRQWQLYLMEGSPYPPNVFLPPELYVYGGGGGGGLNPEEPGLVMVWGGDMMNPGSYSSAWEYEYVLDPDLSNATINVTVTAPQFNALGNQIDVVSFGVRDDQGNIRSWQWRVGLGNPIPWNVPTQVTITPALMGTMATIPQASGFASNPAFNIVNSAVLIVDENARWVGGPSQVPPPGQQIGRIWNYWSNLTVLPNGGQFDWGDAPDPSFPTLGANNGASHVIVPRMFLGSQIDAEVDGQPDPKALGDDNNGVDDEDGVVPNTALIPGNTATVTVTASMPGFLDAWVDFNGNGTWIDPGEQICAATPLVAGANAITFVVSPMAVPGSKVFSRFRYSSVGGLPFTGPASDGEVEDYLAPIGFKWVQNPDLTPMGIDVNATRPFVLADDFPCTTTGPITDIHVWGSWYHDILPGNPSAVKFRLSIHKDVPASPNGAPSHPGELLWYREFQPGQFVVTPYAMEINEGWMNPPEQYEFPGDHACWQYDFYIDKDPFFQMGTQEKPIVYWLDVQAEPMGATEARFGWKTSQKHWNDDAVWGQGTEPFSGPWNEMRYPKGHELEGQSIDLAFAITGKAGTPPQPGHLAVTYHKMIADHFWWPTADQDNEMVSLLVGADPLEDILWNSITLQASGSGNDATDIAAVKVWLDNNGDAVVDPGDTFLGSGSYATDNGAVTIGLTSPQLIAAGTSIKVLISYTMTAAATWGKSYQFIVTAASGIGQTSGLIVGAVITPSPLTSAKKIVGLKPISIGIAKRLPIGQPFLLVDKEITADFMAPTWPTPWQWFYIEEPDRSSGIGVIGGLPGPLHIGDRVSVLGTTTLVNGTELMVAPTTILVTPHDPTVTALGMNNKWTGGGYFGGQPAVLDDAWATSIKFSCGLNNVGSLIRTWGKVTGYGGVTLGGGNWVDVTWIDDGTGLFDGYYTTTQKRSLGIAVVTPKGIAIPLDGYYGVTGILRAIQNPFGNPVRLLVPRDFTTDVTNYPIRPAN